MKLWELVGTLIPSTPVIIRDAYEPHDLIADDFAKEIFKKPMSHNYKVCAACIKKNSEPDDVYMEIWVESQNAATKKDN